MGPMLPGLVAIVMCIAALVSKRADVAVVAALMVVVGCAQDGGKTSSMPSPAGGAGERASAGKNPTVVMKTSLGEITLELDAEKAPITVKNFLDYVEAKHYDGTIFHRVIPAFMIQGGGLTPDMQQKPTKPAIKNEAGNGLKNVPGAIAMARTGVVDSATSQFFINTKANPSLDHRSESPDGFGYAVFGKVTGGMDVVKSIEAVATGNRGGHQNVPVTPVVIESVRQGP